MARNARVGAMWRDFEQIIAALETDLTSNAGVHDCTPLIKAIAKFNGLIGETAFVGFYPEPKGQLRVVRSASFLLRGGISRTLEPIDITERLAREAPPADVAEHFLPDHGKCFNLQLEHVYCRFTPVSLGNAGQQQLTALANLYQRYFLDSRNLENFVDGAVYYYAKPEHERALHPRFSTFSEIADAIHEAFNVSASYLVFTGSRDRNYEPRVEDFRTTDNRRLDQTMSFSSDPQFLRKLGLSVVLKQSIVGSTEHDEHYSIHPASDSTLRKSPVDGLLVVWAPRPISVMCYRAAATWLREFSVRRHLERVRFLNGLRYQVEQEIRRHAEGRVWGRQARLRAIVTLAQRVCQQLCALTNAESGSFRIHELDGDVARQYARHNTPLGGYSASLSSGKMAADIQLSNWRHSAVAFAFKSEDTTSVLHIGNMARISSPYLEQGLESVTQSRPDSRSEAIIRIRQGGLLAAVINLESPVEGALEADIDFLRECGEVMSDFLTRLDTFGDRPALAEIASTHIALHAVKGFVKLWEEGDAPGAEFIARRLKSHMFGRDLANASNQFEFGGKILNIAASNARTVLIRTFHDWIGTALRKIQSDRTSKDILRGTIPSTFALDGLPSLAVIFDSIWTNAVKFRYVDQNSIKLWTPKTTPLGNASLMLEWSAPNKLDERIDRDLLFFRPPVSKADRHYGFMLLGVHVRLLGGRIALIENPEQAGFMLRISLPAPQVRSEP